VVARHAVLAPSIFLGLLWAVGCAPLTHAPQIAPENPTFLALAADPQVHACFADILRRGLIRQDTESAAFVVLRLDHYDCIVWNELGHPTEVSYHGFAPIGIVALVHSHPPGNPRPSLQDLETARQLNLPVFAVTPMEVWVADPVAGITSVVRDMRWAANVNALLRVQR
jgi:Prokaryotic homologs of the JAB domain